MASRDILKVLMIEGVYDTSILLGRVCGYLSRLNASPRGLHHSHSDGLVEV